MGWFNKTYKTIKIEKKENYIIFSLNRPKVFNRINLQMITELAAALKDAQEQKIRGAILTGLGSDFSLGLDFEEIETQLQDPTAYFQKLYEPLTQVLLTIRSMPAPFIAVVRGRVQGLGLSLALCCDFILSEVETVFSSPNINLGMIPLGGLHYFLDRLIGPQKSHEVLFTGKLIGARQAMEMGMISGLIDETQLLQEAKNLAIYFSNGPTQAIGHSKRLIEVSLTRTLKEHLEEEKKACLELVLTKDFKEGIHSLISEDTKSGFSGE